LSLQRKETQQFYVRVDVLEHQSGISKHSWKKYRASGTLPEGLYWFRLNSRVVLYCLPLVLDWLLNHKNDPIAHQQAIENFQALLLSNQSKTRRSYRSKRER
jgi:adenosyl cobinamide kinase/adenosyl cobinamide phosphate guanylyltransferase